MHFGLGFEAFVKMWRSESSSTKVLARRQWSRPINLLEYSKDGCDTSCYLSCKQVLKIVSLNKKW